MEYTLATENTLRLEDEAVKVKKIRASYPRIRGLCAVLYIFRDFAKLRRNSYWTYGPDFQPILWLEGRVQVVLLKSWNHMPLFSGEIIGRFTALGWRY